MHGKYQTGGQRIESDAKARAPRKARQGLPEAVRRGNRMPRGKTSIQKKDPKRPEK
jgi:hypothetical protein